MYKYVLKYIHTCICIHIYVSNCERAYTHAGTRSSRSTFTSASTKLLTRSACVCQLSKKSVASKSPGPQWPRSASHATTGFPAKAQEFSERQTFGRVCADCAGSFVCRRDGIMASWHHGIMASWHHGIMASWHHGTMASWHHGIMAPWHHGTMASWHHGIMASWHHGGTAGLLQRAPGYCRRCMCIDVRTCA